eukprot:TRINITY_DN3335_c0_g1_i1.p1 TRINITY_DN3335_c0_g1~~TRINITY_DN3335_c0_g1_i1.p1  ORF type:complete len:104 (+),score=34.02 TRINITY_DN3335_c0_g1_i1:119-430(+)
MCIRDRINTQAVTRFALVERQSEKVLYLYNIIEQKDGFYYEGNASYRKIYDSNVATRLRFTEPIRLKDLELVYFIAVSYTHLRAHETVLDLVCRLLLEKKKKK